jgi:HlyD family secretion protein
VVRIAPLGEKVDNIIGFEVRVTVQDPEKILRSQMSANAEIVIQEKKNVLAIPESAVVYDQRRRTFADVYDPSAENLKRRAPINIGISNGTLTELVSGLKQGEKVVLQ